MPDPRVAVVVLNWNRLLDTLECLASLGMLDCPEVETVVVDNGSSDGSPEAIARYFPEIQLIGNSANLGYAEGNNVGLRHALQRGVDYILLLNNDTVVDRRALSYLVDVLETMPTAGIAGPTIYYHTQPEVIWSAGGQIDWHRGSTRMLDIGKVDCGWRREPKPVDFVTGCALLTRSEVLRKIGFLDPRFFMYYEETEWCVRVSRAGYRIVHVPEAKIWHKISPTEQADSPRITYYMTRNQLLFLRLCGADPAIRARVILSDLRTIAAWSLRPRYRGKSGQRDAMLAALRDYALGRFGEGCAADDERPRSPAVSRRQNGRAWYER